MDVVYLGLLAAGFGAMWWQHARYVRNTPRLGTRFAEDADIALHVARHAAASRGTDVTTTCILYGLLQDESIAEAIRSTGGDPDLIEDRVLSVLDAPPGERDDDDDVDIGAIIGMLLSIAASHGSRVTCVDLWAGLAQHGPTPSAIVDSTGVSAAEVLFTLVHQQPEKDVPWPAGTSVSLVLINDDISTQELVVETLQQTFGFDSEEAHTLMLRVHNEGRGVIGEFVVSRARAKMSEARRRARDRGFPLWIRAESLDQIASEGA